MPTAYPTLNRNPMEGFPTSNRLYILMHHAKFFIIKSQNFENLKISIQRKEWATTKNNQSKLSNAFISNSRKVFLIFSVNKSGAYQGVARMASVISSRVSKESNTEGQVSLGGSFSVEWHVVCDLPFAKTTSLANPWNNNETLNKSRDTQELPWELGVELVKRSVLQ